MYEFHLLSHLSAGYLGEYTIKWKENVEDRDPLRHLPIYLPQTVSTVQNDDTAAVRALCLSTPFIESLIATFSLRCIVQYH